MKRYLFFGLLGVLAVTAGVVALRGPALAVPLTHPSVLTVREFVAEDAETRLADEYIVDMPVSGTLMRLALEVGDRVGEGEVVARIDPFDIRQRMRSVEAQIAQRRAQMVGVDVAKPKVEDIETARARVREMEDALAAAERRLSVAQVTLDEAELNFRRAQGLYEAGVVSEAFLDDAELGLQAAREEREVVASEVKRSRQLLEQAELAYRRVVGSMDDNEYQREALRAEVDALASELAMLKDDLEATSIRAPVTGPVLEKYVEDRRVLAEGTPILRIGDLSSIELETDILSEEITAVTLGNPVVIRGKAISRRMTEGGGLRGVVKRIYPSGFEKISSLGVEQQRVKVLIDFDNSEVNLRPGVSVDVEIVTAESENALAVPDRAVFRHAGGHAVFVVEDGRARIQQVEIGLRNEDWAEIVQGLSEEDRIVAELHNDLEEGARVTLLE